MRVGGRSCEGFCSVPGPLQTVQWAELWGVFLALQSSGALHLGVDNLNVVRHVGRLLDGHSGSSPFEVVNDGDLLLLIDRMLHRWRVGHAGIDAGRNFCGVCGRWYPVISNLHRFFIAISRAVVDHDGGDGMAPDPLVWSAAGLPKRRRLVHAVRDLAMLPGPPAVWASAWFSVPASAICAEDVAHRPFSVSLLVRWVAFLGSLHWPVSGADLGGGFFC